MRGCQTDTVKTLQAHANERSMDDDGQKLTPRDLWIGTGLVLLVRLWIDGAEERQPAIRGHLSMLGGRHIGSFNSLPALFAMIEAATRNPKAPSAQEKEDDS
jgi:hypothetical protein